MLHAYVNVPDPPVTVACAVPLHDPLQVGSVREVTTLSAAGWVMVVLLVLVQPYVSVIVIVYVPGQSPVAFWLLVLFDQLYEEYVPEPPLPVARALPLQAPKQLTCVGVIVTVGWAYTVMF